VDLLFPRLTTTKLQILNTFHVCISQAFLSNSQLWFIFSWLPYVYNFHLSTPLPLGLYWSTEVTKTFLIVVDNLDRKARVFFEE
jgi:hypothetical protein